MSLFVLCSTFILQPIAIQQSQTEIKRTITSFYQAVDRRDWPLVRTILHPDWKLFTPIGSIQGVDELLADWQENAPTIKATLSEIKIHISQDGQMAWATYHQNVKMIRKGKNADMTALITTIFQKDKTWKMIHTHRTSARASVYLD